MDGTHRYLAVGASLLSLVLMALAASTSADSRVLEPGVPFEVTEHADAIAYIYCNWSVPSGANIHFLVLGPGGDVFVDTNASSYNSTLLTPDSGDYLFRWTNVENSSTTLSYDVVSQSTGIDNARPIFDTIFLGILVGAVVVVIIIVLVIVVAMRGGGRRQSVVKGTPAQHAPPGEAPSPYVPGMCPRCGSPFDSQHTFCPKCGHRVR